MHEANVHSIAHAPYTGLITVDSLRAAVEVVRRSTECHHPWVTIIAVGSANEVGGRNGRDNDSAYTGAVLMNETTAKIEPLSNAI